MATATSILNQNPPKCNQTGFAQYPVQSKSDRHSSGKKSRESPFIKKKKRKKCAASTFILEMVLLADKIQIYVGGICSQSSPWAADCVGHQSHFQATIARYGCSNCSQLSAEPFCLSPSNLRLSLCETLMRNGSLVLWWWNNAENRVHNHLKLCE